MSTKGYGHSGSTASTIDANVTHTARYLIGPPSRGGGSAQGIYVLQTSGATPEYRWIEDQPLPAGQKSPTTYTAGNF